ncbi:hypothetical protein BN1088_1433333 [Sphingobacterium sp. PM2-P1-29]|nr:hypothetical protein BN1088_1433333 [Sphingobacterium sp. PM2-P1-29]
MKNSNSTPRLATKAIFSFKQVLSEGKVKSTQHPTTGTTTNSTFIFNCLK